MDTFESLGKTDRKTVLEQVQEALVSARTLIAGFCARVMMASERKSIVETVVSYLTVVSLSSRDMTAALVAVMRDLFTDRGFRQSLKDLVRQTRSLQAEIEADDELREAATSLADIFSPKGREEKGNTDAVKTAVYIDPVCFDGQLMTPEEYQRRWNEAAEREKRRLEFQTFYNSRNIKNASDARESYHEFYTAHTVSPEQGEATGDNAL